MNMPNYGSLKNDGSAYVKDMTHHAHIDINGETTVKFEDTAADASNLADLITVAASTSYDVDIEIKEPYGRALSILSTDAGDLTITGFDYLGQAMTETITCIVGNAAGAKAFKRVTKITSAADLAGDVTIRNGGRYGLPFCIVEVVREIVDGAASSEGTIIVPITATPTDTTGDVRGTYNPNTAGDGAKDISLTYITTADLPGGLYGQQQA